MSTGSAQRMIHVGPSNQWFSLLPVLALLNRVPCYWVSPAGLHCSASLSRCRQVSLRLRSCTLLSTTEHCLHKSLSHHHWPRQWLFPTPLSLASHQPWVYRLPFSLHPSPRRPYIAFCLQAPTQETTHVPSRKPCTAGLVPDTSVLGVPQSPLPATATPLILGWQALEVIAPSAHQKTATWSAARAATPREAAPQVPLCQWIGKAAVTPRPNMTAVSTDQQFSLLLQYPLNLVTFHLALPGALGSP